MGEMKSREDLSKKTNDKESEKTKKENGHLVIRNIAVCDATDCNNASVPCACLGGGN